MFELNGVPIGAVGLRGHLGARPAGHDARRSAGAQVMVNLSASPYRARQGRRARADARPARRATTWPPWCSATPWAARTSSCSTATAWWSTTRARCWRARPSSRSRWPSARSTRARSAAARLRDTRHRGDVRRQRRAAAAPEAWSPGARARGARHAPARRVGGPVRRCSARRRRCTPRCAPACATTWTRTASSAWCWRCRAGSTRRSWRCSQSTRSGPERVTCVTMPSPYSSRGHPRGRRGDRREPRHGASWSCRIEEAMARVRRAARGAVRGHRAGHRRGEPPGPHPRQGRDGALEQVRLARAHHRQQVRAVGGLRHALRRHGGRVRRAEGRVQGLGLPPRALAQRAGGTELVPARCSSARRPRSCAHEQLDEDSLPPYDVLDAILAGYVEEDLDAAELVARGWRRGRGARDRLVDRAEYKRRQAPPGIKISTKAFGRDRRLPITNGYESTPCRAERHLRALK